MPHTRPAKQSVAIHIRATARQRDLIDLAAEKQGRTRSEFMSEASCREAEDVLFSQTFFSVGADAFGKFQKLLMHPLPPTARLRRLLKTKAPWEKSRSSLNSPISKLREDS